jgi:hypothetical protein
MNSVVCSAVCSVVTVGCSLLRLCENKVRSRLCGPKSNGFNGKIGILRDNLMGCAGFLLLLGGYDVLQNGMQSVTEFWFVFMLDSKMFVVS